MNVMVINQYAGNKGDRAVAYFITRELARNRVSRIILSTHDRSLWRGNWHHLDEGVQLVPWGWYAEGKEARGMRKWWRLPGRRTMTRKLFYPVIRRRLIEGRRLGCARFLCNAAFRRALSGADLVLSTGGHHVTTLLARDAVSGQLYDMALAVLWKKPLILWSQSIGPLHFADPRNEAFVRAVLSGTAEIIVRDAQSLEEIEGLGIAGPDVRRTYESVIGLNDLFGDYVLPSRREPLLGISTYTAQPRSQSHHTAYVAAIAALADHAVEKGYQVRFFPMELRGAAADDRPMIRDILRSARYGSACTVQDEDIDVREHMAAVARCRVFVGHKTHSVIFALTAGTPVIALAYHKKIEEFMRQYGLDKYCIQDSELTVRSLPSVFDDACRSLDATGAQVFARSREFGHRVRAELGRVLERSYRRTTMRMHPKTP